MLFNQLLINFTKFTKHNMNYIDKVHITLYNPKTIKSSNIFRKYPINMTVYFEKDNMQFNKDINCNTMEECYNRLKQTIDNEIKI